MTTPDEKELLGLIEEVKNDRISRKQFVYRALGMGLSASAVGGLLAACGKKKEAGTTSATNTIGPTTKPAELYLYNWSDYMAPGVKKDFEKETGIKVVESFFDDNEALYAKLNAGATGYDVIVPSDYMCHIMIMSKLLEPLVMDYIPNFQYVDEQFKEPVYDNPAENGDMKYSVPYQWGTTGYAVRTDKLDPVPTTWAAIFPPEADPLKGGIQMLNDERECPGCALILGGHSINTTDQGELDEATQKLIEQKPLVRAYDSVNMKRSMVQGTPITMCWNGDCLMAIDALGGDEKAKSLLAWVMPQEGYMTWVDTLAIPTGYRNKYAAHLFMDYLLKPEVMAKLSSWTWYLPVETEPARQAGCDPFVFTTVPTPEDVKRGELYNDVGAFARSYKDAWAQVKSS